MSGTRIQTAKGMRKTEYTIKIAKGAGTMNVNKTAVFQDQELTLQVYHRS